MSDDEPSQEELDAAIEGAAADFAAAMPPPGPFFAARVSDLHICPMVTGVVPHVGGPILPPGQINVLIGNMPAARMGDMCTCAGPPDVIVRGEPTVLIGGKPAARFMDTTSHGGMITTGFPTVIIGSASGGSTGAPGAVPAGGGTDAGASDDCVRRAAEIDRQDEVLERAALAADVYDAYDPAKPDDKPPPGFERISDNPERMRELLGLNDEQIDNLIRPDGSSYRAAVYQNDEGKTFVVFRGTENREGAKDWIVNGQQGSGFRSQHYEDAKTLSQAISGAVGPENMEVVGHSKGGGMAAGGGVVTGAQTTTFNSAGLHQNTVPGHDISNPSNIESYVVDGEVLNWVQDNRRVVQGGVSGLVGGLFGGLAGLGTGYLTKDTIPPSIGNRHAVPAVWPEGGEPAWYDPVAYRAELHGMAKVIEGLEHQRDQMIIDYNDAGCATQTGPR